MKIVDITKKYETVFGNEVTIYATDHPGAYPVIGRIEDNEDISTWTKKGTCYDTCADDDDLREVSIWKGFNDGDDVIVWNNDSHYKKKRIFSGVNEHGLPCTYADGRNKWTSCDTDENVVWDNCIKKETYNPEIHGEF